MKKILIALVTAIVFVSTPTQTISFAHQTTAPATISLQPLTNINLSLLGNGLTGNYYSDKNLANFTSFRIDKTVNFDWGKTQRPISTVKHDNFSVRWTGYFVPTFNEVYTFTTRSDDGVRLYINDTLVINDWNVQGVEEQTANVQLVAGQPYSIKLEYFQNTSSASVKLYWASNSQRKEIIPESHLYTQKVQAVKRGNGTGLSGSYFSGKDFNKLTRTRTDSTINFKWNSHDVKKSGAFSIRWNGRVQPLYTDLYSFRTLSDDGVRVWVNNQLIIDNWKDMGETESIGKIQLVAGQLYDIKVEYYENGDWPATMRLYWSSAYQRQEIIPKYQLFKPEVPKPGTGNGLKAEYFGDKTLTLLKAIKIDTDINFDWGNRGLPVDGVAHNNFSVRWTGKLQPLYTQFYTFKTVSDDGIRLWINGKLLIDDWKTQSVKQNSAKIDLQAGIMYDVKIEYYQETGLSRCELYWSSDSQKQQIVPQTQLYGN